jgi:hypothetical protein
VRRLLIRYVLPLIFCLIPVLAALLVAVAVPPEAMAFYLSHVSTSHIDWLILGLGAGLFAMQTLLGWRALQWRGTGFNERPDRWLSHLAQAAEWFPMLGLIGTVMAILYTFNDLSVQAASETQVKTSRIIASYAPAITATGSGLFMALINMFPTWMVLIGRDVIVSLGGGGPSPSGERP